MNPNLSAWGARARGPRNAGFPAWDDPKVAALADHLEDRAEASAPQRLERAGRAKDRIHRAGAEALSQHFGVRADVKDPSFGDDARVIDMPHPSAPGYRVRVAGPHPHTTDYGAITNWSMKIDPPGVEHYVGGEEVHHEELGHFKPRELHKHVERVLAKPEVQAKVQGDQHDVLTQVERGGRTAARAPVLRSHEVSGPQGALDHLQRGNLSGGQFG